MTALLHRAGERTARRVLLPTGRLDHFSNGGAVLALEELLEGDRAYVDLAMQRWSDVTSKEPELVHRQDAIEATA